MSILMRTLEKMNDWLASRKRGKRSVYMPRESPDFHLESDSYTAGLVDYLFEMKNLIS